jgi:acetyltransferase-like isoleucine patch superfamily enzyme
VLKGSSIPDGCVVAANTCITKKFEDENVVRGGYPAKILKKEIYWEG